MKPIDASPPAPAPAPDDAPRSPARRVFLRTIAAGAAAATLPACPGRATVRDDAGAMDAGDASDATAPDVAPPNCDGGTRFFSDDERAVINALGDYVLPADPGGPGASGLGLVAYIEQLLTAFDAPSGNPKIFAGGPFSNRNPYPAPLGGVPGMTYPSNDFANFLPLGRVQTLAWKLRILGSAGVPGGGPNDAITGAIPGLRTVMKNGACHALSLLAGRAPAALTSQEVAMLWPSLDPHFTSQLVQFVAEASFSAPEYGGNAGGLGWQMIHFEGDAQPLGFSIYDPMTMTYRDRPGAPDAVADPGPDPDPFDMNTRNTIAQFTRLLGGRIRTS